MKPSTLSKRWKTSLPTRVWPYRAARKLQKQIIVLQDLESKGFNVRAELDQLTTVWRATLEPAVIVINDKLEDSIRGYANEAIASPSPTTPPTQYIPNTTSVYTSIIHPSLHVNSGVPPPPPLTTLYPPSTLPGSPSSPLNDQSLAT